MLPGHTLLVSVSVCKYQSQDNCKHPFNTHTCPLFGEVSPFLVATKPTNERTNHAAHNLFSPTRSTSTVENGRNKKVRTHSTGSSGGSHSRIYGFGVGVGGIKPSLSPRSLGGCRSSNNTHTDRHGLNDCFPLSRFLRRIVVVIARTCVCVDGGNERKAFRSTEMESRLNSPTLVFFGAWPMVPSLLLRIHSM